MTSLLNRNKGHPSSLKYKDTLPWSSPACPSTATMMVSGMLLGAVLTWLSNHNVIIIMSVWGRGDCLERCLQYPSHWSSLGTFWNWTQKSFTIPFQRQFWAERRFGCGAHLVCLRIQGWSPTGSERSHRMGALGEWQPAPNASKSLTSRHGQFKVWPL